jgi:hypothetical protein
LFSPSTLNELNRALAGTDEIDSKAIVSPAPAAGIASVAPRVTEPLRWKPVRFGATSNPPSPRGTSQLTLPVSR